MQRVKRNYLVVESCFSVELIFEPREGWIVTSSMLTPRQTNRPKRALTSMCMEVTYKCHLLGLSLRALADIAHVQRLGQRDCYNSKQLFTILDCKMLVQYYCTSCNLKLSRLVDFLASILEYGVESVFPSCFADNADHGSIYCKQRETDSFILPSLNKSGVRTDCVTFTQLR